MQTKKTTHGGKRKGAGRPKSAPTVVYQLKISKELNEDLKKIPVKERNHKIKVLMIQMVCGIK